MCVIVVCWTGDHDAGHDVVAPLLDSDVGPPVASGVDAVPYPALQSSFDDLAPPGLHQHWRGEFVTALTDDVIDVHATYGPSVPTIPSLVHLYPLDGATGRVPTDATAFAYRDADHSVLIAAQDPEAHNLSEHAAWVDEYWAALRAHSAGGAYVNFMMQEGPDRVAAAFRDNYDRLTQVKRRYDPANLFRQNQNVPPA